MRLVPHALKAGVRTFERRESPYKQVYYWSLWAEPEDPSPETDIGALARGFLTVTPLRVDANDPSALEGLKGWGLTSSGRSDATSAR